MTREDHESRRKWFKEKASTKTYRFPKEPLSMYGRQRIVAFAGESGKQLWCNKEQRPAGEIMPATMAVSGGKVCFQTTSHVVCLDGGSGKEQWRSERPVATSRFSWATPTLVIHDGAVISGDRMAKDNIGDEPEKGSRWIMDNHHQMRKQPGEIVAFSMKDGSELWRAPAFENYTIPMDIFVIDDTVWVGHIRSKRYPGFTKGRDLMTGKVTSKIPDNGKLYDLQMGHNRCYRNKATCRFLILGRDGVEFVDPKKGTGNGNWWVRGTCQYGVMPANGLLYVPIHSCACHPTEELKGFNTLSPNSSADGSIDEAGRLDKGPAYGTKPGKTDPAASDWPTYRRDAGRSGYQGIDAPDDPATAWTAECSPPITAPVSAGGRVYVAETDKHAVRVFDAQDGKPLWTFIAEGRIDSPPTIVGGLCLFGTRNGFVYCLRAEDGKPAWRFRAAPRDRLLFSHEQTESVWPVHGSVLVDRTAAASSPVVYFAAGRSSHLDGGIRLYALDIATGEEVRTATVAMASDADGVIKARALPDVLSLQDGSIYMRNLRFDRQLKRQKGNVRHLYAPAGFLDTTWWHRTYWVFGTNMRSAYGGWPRVGNVTPAGRLLVCDGGDLIYGYGRLSYRAGAGHVNPDATKDYKVFAEVRSPETKADARKRRRRGGGRRELTWSESLPFITRAMVLSRDALIVAGGQSLPGASGDNGPGIFSIVSRKDGARGAECALPAAPVLDGMALTGSGVFVATIDGKVVCLR